MRTTILVITLGLLLPLQAGPEADQREFAAAVVAFGDPWARFLAALVGCPSVMAEPKDCRPAQGKFDATAFFEARRAAKRLFQLEDREVNKRMVQ